MLTDYFMNRNELINVDNDGEAVTPAVLGDSMENFSALAVFGSYGTGERQLNAPVSAAVYKNFVFVSDSGNNRIVKWNLQGGVYEGEIDFYGAKLLIKGRYLYILDSLNDDITKYDADTLLKVGESDAFTDLVDMAFSKEYLYVISGSLRLIYELNPNTFEIVRTITLSAISADYTSITTDGLFLYVLSGDTIYKVLLTAPDSGTYYVITELTPQKVRYHDGYLLLGGDSDNFLVLDLELNVLLDDDYDDTNWYSSWDVSTYRPFEFVSVDSVANQIEIIYGYNPDAGKESGDTATFGDFDFGDDISIGGDESELPTLTFVKDDPAKGTSRKWRRND